MKHDDQRLRPRHVCRGSSRRAAAWLPVLAAAMVAGVAACGGTPSRSSQVDLQIAVGTSINPDPAGRASPIVVRLYQLSDDTAFRQADFYALFEREAEILGSVLVKRDEFVLQPGETREFGWELDGATGYVAALAAFRDLGTAQWRAITPASAQARWRSVRRQRVHVNLDDRQVGISLNE